jgi:hypothetical protein
MNAIALIVIAVLSAGTCEFLSDARQSKQAPKEAFAGLTRYLEKLNGAVDFVTNKSGVYRFYPKGVYRGITYDGTIATDLVPNEATNTFTVITYMYVNKHWSEAERDEVGAVDLLRKLGQNNGAALGVPASMRREMSQSSIHRRVICGIQLAGEVKNGPQ